MDRIKVKKMDEDWKERLKDRWWATNYAGNKDNFTEVQGRMLKLRDKLISYGGEEVCFFDIDSDLNKLMARGELIIIRDSAPNNIDEALLKLVKGEASQCHKNSSIVWSSNRESKKFDGKLYLVTGYALSEDGMWRQHSWCLLKQPDGTNTIIETTLKRVAYYGFEMDEEEALHFALSNR